MMSRIACLRIPRFQIAVHQKHEPALRKRPFILLAGKLATGGSGRARVLMCSEEAVHKEIYPGMKLSQARALCADLIWREEDPALYLDAHKKLVQALIACSPKVTAQDPGIFLLDASGLKHLGGESKFCRSVLEVAGRAGFANARVGIADSAFAALVATDFKSDTYMIQHGQDAEFLAPLSIEHLPIDPDMREALQALGVKSMGQLSELPARSVLERFGQQGALAHQLAQGKDRRQPELPVPDKEFLCSVDLAAPLESLHDTIFVLKSMTDRLSIELEREGLLADELALSLYNDNDKFDERSITFLRPSNNAKFLLEIIRLSLESQPLKREFTAVTLAVTRFSRESWAQLNLSRKATLAPANETSDAASPTVPPVNGAKVGPARARGRVPPSGTLEACAPPGAAVRHSVRSPSNAKHALGQSLAPPLRYRDDSKWLPDSLMLLVQRFLTRFRKEIIARPVASDQYFPDGSGVWVPLLQEPSAYSVLPVNIEYTKDYPGWQLSAGSMALRRHSCPLPVAVELEDATPVSVRYNERWYRIATCTQPERLSGLWWDEPVQKSYYIALLAHGANAWAGLRPAHTRERVPPSSTQDACAPPGPPSSTQDACAPPAGADSGLGQSLAAPRRYHDGEAPRIEAAPGGALALLVHDHRLSRWFIEGFFD